jgi:ubiquitin C-terminal hydrolase
MKYKYIKKKNKIFKNTLKNEIKNTFIKPILVELENKKKEISEIKNLLENLNNNMLESKSNIEKEINSKIEIIKNGNENLSEQFKNHKINTEKMINKYDNNFIDLNKKIENINLNIKNVENENKKEIGDLQKKLSNDINKLKNDINSDINLKDQEFNSKLEGISKSAKKNKSEIEEIKEEIKKLETEQIKLKNLDENKTKKLNELDKKIMSNKSKLDNAIKDIDLINKNSKKNMQSIVNESFKKFNNIFQKSFALNKYKLQKELKLKLFSDKNLAQVGLNNIGNNCYQNSVLQILKNIPKFVYNFYLMDKNSDKFLLSLKNLFIKTCFSNQNSFCPDEFKALLGKENKKFEGNHQYDSTIFYISLLNIIQKKINRPKINSKATLNMKQYADKSLEEKYKIWKEHYLSQNQTFIIDYFYTFYVNEIECDSCDYKSHCFQCCNYLDFPIVSTNGKIENLEECFSNYQKKQFIGECSDCHEDKLCQHYILLELPPILIINLKRVGEKKAYFNEIEIPYKLEMEKLIKYKYNNSIYELRGFIKHSGDENSGHNYAFCKNIFDDLWYEYNDSYCSKLKEKPNLDKIFLLCYVKVGSDIQDVNYLNEIMKSIDEKNNFKKSYFK